jgi:hypothetical protein
MLSFKKWIQKENLAGPGGGPNFSSEDQESLNLNISMRGAGAFPSFSQKRKFMSKNKSEKMKRKKFIF